MTWESGSTDHQRMRAGYVVLSIGICILLFAWALAAARGPEGAGHAASQEQKLELPTPRRVLPALGTGMILYGAILITILFASVFAIYRLSRAYGNQLLRKPSRKTEAVDAWKMHQVPDLGDETFEED